MIRCEQYKEILEGKYNSLKEITDEFNISRNILIKKLIDIEDCKDHSLTPLLNEVSKKDRETLIDISTVTDISEVEEYETVIDEDYIRVEIVFKDQDDNLRSVNLYWDLVPGMVAYYKYHENIKKELIDLINETYLVEAQGRGEI